MSEFCPLRLGGPHFDLSGCEETCSTLWDEAVIAGEAHFEDYVEHDREIGLSSDCVHVESEFSHDALHALGRHLRSYVTVEQCVSCGDELAESGYEFICPLPVEE